MEEKAFLFVGQGCSSWQGRGALPAGKAAAVFSYCCGPRQGQGWLQAPAFLYQLEFEGVQSSPPAKVTEGWIRPLRLPPSEKGLILQVSEDILG